MGPTLHECYNNSTLDGVNIQQGGHARLSIIITLHTYRFDDAQFSLTPCLAMTPTKVYTVVLKLN